MNGSATRLYYLDGNETTSTNWRWNNNAWVNTNITANVTDPPAPAAAAGSALACFGVNGSATRLYYLDGIATLNELAWNNNAWVNTNITANVTDPPAPAAAAGSALACFGVNGSATRLYYLDGNSHVNELAWNNNAWVNTNITAKRHRTHPHPRPPPAAPWPASE